MELPTDPKKRRRVLAKITGPMRMRELGLKLARASGEDFDEIIGAVRHLGPAWAEWERFIQGVKTRVVNELEKAAEWEYQARVREDALHIMEGHPNMKADEAVAVVESIMLDAAFTPNA